MCKFVSSGCSSYFGFNATLVAVVFSCHVGLSPHLDKNQDYFTDFWKKKTLIGSLFCCIANYYSPSFSETDFFLAWLLISSWALCHLFRPLYEYRAVLLHKLQNFNRKTKRRPAVCLSLESAYHLSQAIDKILGLSTRFSSHVQSIVNFQSMRSR